MKILKFKTNINSGDDVQTLSRYLDNEQSISKWNVDTESDENLLSVSGELLEPVTVKKLVHEAGYEAEVLRVQGIGGGDM
jgi:translation elongation factor EF-G